MTIFHVLKYPVRESMPYEEFNSLPTNVLAKFFEWERYNYYATGNEKIQFIRKTLLEYEDTNDNTSCN